MYIILGYIHITYLHLAFLLMHTTHTMTAMMIKSPPVAAPIMVSIGGSCTSDLPKHYSYVNWLHSDKVTQLHVYHNIYVVTYVGLPIYTCICM